MSESSAIAKRCFDPERLGTKPDFTVMITNPQKHVELFIIEIKPNKMNNALILEDFVSFRKTMKYAIDKSIKDGADNLVICGMQVIILGKSLCDGPLVQRDLPHDINWRVRASKGFHIVIVNKKATSYQIAIRMNKKSKSRIMIKLMFHSPTKKRIVNRLINNVRVIQQAWRSYKKRPASFASQIWNALRNDGTTNKEKFLNGDWVKDKKIQLFVRFHKVLVKMIENSEYYHRQYKGIHLM
ncbi:hypothetical protein RhiirA4_455614 [Rhizophagus irregularis]|uniref:Uncharacterized protein n=1 Tax=Rhizophagus irregularis TaxID=588596 RepID=A0A2I1G5M3_9GLOM|nr:hypothetical protein RhiirA4_455614 [Rhizophagus irregularis]